MGLRIPSVDSEIELIARYGVRTLAVTLHEEGAAPNEIAAARDELQARLGIPVVRPLREGVESLVPVLRELVDEENK